MAKEIDNDIELLEKLFLKLEKKGLSKQDILNKLEEKRLLESIDKEFSKLERKGISKQEVVKQIDEKRLEKVALPYSIFDNNHLSPLESITKYLRENLGLNYNQISKVLGRNPIQI